MRVITVIFFFSFSFCLFSQVKKKVLFIGNSYTYVNNLPQLVADIALSESDTVIYDQSTPGGYTFFDHCSNPVTWTKIRSQKWDVVVLQAQSQEPSVDLSVVMSQTFPFAKQLCDSVRANNGCSKILFYMTWGRKNGDASNCPTYSNVCTYNGMQTRLRESYMMFKDSFITSVAPVGVAWKNFRNAFPTIDLYQVDESHPSLHGSYLAACVFYSAIFQKTSVGSSYNPSLPVADLGNIQSICSQTVLDSIDIWNLNCEKPKAFFTAATTGPLTFQFMNSSVNATNYIWSFGSTIKNPVYTFPSPGNYTVSLIASNTCTNDTINKVISVTGIKENKSMGGPKVYYLNHTLMFDDFDEYIRSTISVYDMDGRKIIDENVIPESKILGISNVLPGIYLVAITSNTAKYFRKIVITD